MESIADKVEFVLEKVRPYVQMHGGDVCLREVRDSVVVLKIDGNCVNCTLANFTYNKLITPLIKERAPEVTDVIIEY